MSQFEQTYADPMYAQPQAQPKTSALAVVSFILSLIICCPLTTALGVLLGLISIVTIGEKKGRILAILAVIFGTVLTIGWIVGYVWYDQNFKTPQAEGPREELTAAFAGDADTYRSSFFGDAALASDEDVERFVVELRSRYGEFVTCEMDEAAYKANLPSLEEMMQPVQVLPYVIEFSNATLNAKIEVSASDPNTNEFLWRLKFGQIVIFDPDLGDLVFPVADAAVPAASPLPVPGDGPEEEPTEEESAEEES